MSDDKMLEQIKADYPEAEVRTIEGMGAVYLTIPQALTAEEADEIRQRFMAGATRERVTILGEGMTVGVMDFDQWLTFGMSNGWVSDQVCATHDGVPSTDEGRVEWDEGGDPCEVVLRVWPTEKWQEMRDAATRA